MGSVRGHLLSAPSSEAQCIGGWQIFDGTRYRTHSCVEAYVFCKALSRGIKLTSGPLCHEDIPWTHRSAGMHSIKCLCARQRHLGTGHISCLALLFKCLCHKK